MSDKILLGEGELKGWKEGVVQRYKIHYMPEVKVDGQVKYEHKIEFQLIEPGKEAGKFFFHSLRFVSADQLKIVIFKLIKAYGYMLSKEGRLNPNTANSLPALFSNQVKLDIGRLTNEIRR